MINVTIDNAEVTKLLRQLPKATTRALEKAIDQTADEIKDSIWSQLPKFFDRPTPYTLNSLKVEKTRNHNMQASVWFKEPDRMAQHYLIPQVEGIARQRTGFERALGYKTVPSKVFQAMGKLDRYGNVSPGLMRQILSVLGRAERLAGYTANKSARSEKTNRKSRDFLLLQPGNKQGLPPGVYERYQTAAGFGAKTKKHLPFGTWQKSQAKWGYKHAIIGRGLRPIMLMQKNQSQTYTQRLPFYRIAGKIIDARLNQLFNHNLAKYL